MTMTKKAHEDLLWKAHSNQPSTKTVDALLEFYKKQVEKIVGVLVAKKRIPGSVEDYIAAGLFGLWQAIQGFDPGRGFRFMTYASARIRGAVMDECREADKVGRCSRRHLSKLNDVRAKFKAVGLRPTTEELCKGAGLSLVQFWAAMQSFNVLGSISSIDDATAMRNDDDTPVLRRHVIPQTRERTPLEELERKSMLKFLVKGFSRIDRQIILMYYFQGATMKQVGEALDLSESRISQLHSVLLKRLETRLETRRDEVFA